MKAIIAKSCDDFNTICANIIFATMLQDKRVNLSLTGGKSPKDVFPKISDLMKRYKNDLSNVHYYNFDNFEDYNPNGLGGGMNVLKDQYLDEFEVEEDHIHLMTVDNYKTFYKEIENNGGLDLVVMGMGEDGHFCANMPSISKFDEKIYLLPIDKTNPVYINFYGDKPIPDYMASFGAELIMKAKQIVLLVNGSHKADSVYRLVHEQISTAFPSTVLKLHPNFVLLLDEESAAKL